jgi:hypothetical protein
MRAGGIRVTLTQATEKARRIAADCPAVVVIVADPAHGNGEGENRFDAVPLDVFEADQRGGRYLTLWRSIHRRKHEDG